MNHFKQWFFFVTQLLSFFLFKGSLYYGITATFCPCQVSVQILPLNSQRTHLRRPLTNVIGICRLTLCRSWRRSCCSSKEGTVDPTKLGSPHISWIITLKTLWPSYSLLPGSCGASTQILLKRASLWSEASGPTASLRTWTPSIKMCRETLFCFSKVNNTRLRVTSSVEFIHLRFTTKKSGCMTLWTSNYQPWVFFPSSGQQYWRMRQLEVEEGFPRNISHLGFPSRITSVDAALHLRNIHTTVFFTGHECWRCFNRWSCSRRDATNPQWWPGNK